MYWLLSRRRVKTLEMGDGWWGPGKKPLREKEDEGIRPFQVKTSEKEIQVPLGKEQGTEQQEPTLLKSVVLLFLPCFTFAIYN